MLKTLQTNEGRISRTGGTVRPATIVLDEKYSEVVMEHVQSAVSDVRICAYNWKWYAHQPELSIQKLNIALYRLRERGVKVRVLIDTEKARDYFRALGFECRSVESTRMLHTKALSFDTETIVLGSHNLTKRAHKDNYELSIVCHEFDVVKGFNEYFDRLWAAYA